MENIKDYITQLSIGSLVFCKFDASKDRLLQVTGLIDQDEKKVLVGVPDGIEGNIVECLPATINKAVLLAFGFTEETIMMDESSELRYVIHLRNKMSLGIGKRPNSDRWNVFILLQTTWDEPDNVIYIGHVKYFFKIQDTYRTFTSKNLQWKQ